MVQQYLDVARQILTSPYSTVKSGTKDAGLISLIGPQTEYDLREGIPLVTTKQTFTRSVLHELVWFLSGDTNIAYLEKNKVPIWRRDTFEHNETALRAAGHIPQERLKRYSPEWDAAVNEYGARVASDEKFAAEFGNSGPIYGQQWRRLSKGDGTTIDQIGNMIAGLKKNPNGKKHIVNTWHVPDIPNMSLPPCHTFFQAISDGQGHLDMKMYQRSADWFLGVPFNIFSYVALAQVIAREVGMEPRRFIHTFGDAHIYAGLEKRSAWYAENFAELQKRVAAIPMEDRERHLEVLDWIDGNAPKDGIEEKYDHVTAILEQLARKPFPKSRLFIAQKPLDDLVAADFKVEGYEHHPKIIREMAV